MTELQETFDPFNTAMDTLAVLVEPDPISARIDSYLAALSALDARYAGAREALHTEFKADIAALVRSENWQVYPEGQRQQLAQHREIIRDLKSEPVSLGKLAQVIGKHHVR